MLQIPLFTLIIFLGRRRRQASDDPATAKSLDVIPGTWAEKAGCVGYAFFGGVRYACLYSAVLFVPMADFIVICATTPIFSYLFSRLFLKSKLTVIKVRLALPTF